MRVARRPLNPVLARELRQRMRGPRAAIVITVYLLLLAGILQLLYTGISQATGNGSGPSAEEIATLGRTVFQTMLFFVLVLVCFIVPGLTAGAIAGERERQTLVPLQVTLLSPLEIVAGKLLASLSFVGLLVVATLPLLGVSFLFGGVEPWEATRTTAMVLVVAVLLASLALACSAFFRRTAGATVVSYAIVLFLLFGTFILFGAQLLLARDGPQGRTQAVLFGNPFMAVASVLDEPEGGIGSSGVSPFTPFQALIEQRQEPPDDDFTDEIFGPGLEPVPEERFQPNVVNRVPFWVWSLLSMAAVSGLSLWFSARRVAVPKATG